MRADLENLFFFFLLRSALSRIGDSYRRLPIPLSARHANRESRFCVFLTDADCYLSRHRYLRVSVRYL